MRKIVFLILVLGMASASWAQTSQGSWANSRALQAGQKIQIINVNSKKHSGTLMGVSDTAISYRDTAGEQTRAESLSHLVESRCGENPAESSNSRKIIYVRESDRDEGHEPAPVPRLRP